MRTVMESKLVSLDGVIGDPMVWADGSFDEEAVATSPASGASATRCCWAATSTSCSRRPGPQPPATTPRPGPRSPRRGLGAPWPRRPGPNTTIVGGDVPGAVRELKEHGHGELVRYGHGRLGQALLDHGLLDELGLWVHPLVVGHGSWLSGPDARARLRLVGTQTRANGVVVTDEAAR
jgi:RibD C-terminal domain